MLTTHGAEKKSVWLKLLTVAILSAASLSLLFLSDEKIAVFDDLSYIPVILACLWFGRKGLMYAAALTCALLLAKYLAGSVLLWDDALRSLILLAVGVLTQQASGRLKKQRAYLDRLNNRLRTDNERFRKAELLAGMGIWEMDLKTGKTVWSDGMFELFGCRPGAFEPTLDIRLGFSHPEDRAAIRAHIEESIRDKKEFNIENRIIKPDGSVRWVHSLGYLEPDAQGEPEKFIGALLDITERKLSEMRLFDEKEKFRITIASVGDGVISADTDGMVTLMNEAAEKLTGWTQEEAVGLPFTHVFNIVNEITGERCDDPVGRVLREGTIIGLANHTALISRQGTERSIADCASPIRDGAGNVRGAVLVFRDVTEEKRRQNEINYISYHDSLTGLYNRRYLEELLTYYDMGENLPISVIMGDVNGLKLTNDAFGHQAGDRLLRKVTEAILSVCRADDVAVRWGGDEFVILLPRTSGRTAEQVIRRMRDKCAAQKVDTIDVSVAFGSCTKNSVDENIMVILKNAEDHMYENKIIESESMRGNLVKTILNTLHEKNPGEEQHSVRVSAICQDIGKAMQMPESDINKLKLIGLLHDIGKIAVDETVLNKPGRLDAREWNEIKRHPDIGFRILCSSHEMAELADYVLSHHEKVDGTGYPRGLKGDDIPVLSKIVAVADAYDAMTSERKYRAPMAQGAVIDEIKKNKGLQFDPNIAEIFLDKVLPNYS